MRDTSKEVHVMLGQAVIATYKDTPLHNHKLKYGPLLEFEEDKGIGIHATLEV